MRRITELFTFFKEFSIPGFKKLSGIAKLISRSLETEIKFNGFSTQWKRTLFLYEAPGEPIINECFLVIEDKAIECINRHFGLYTSH